MHWVITDENGNAMDPELLRQDLQNMGLLNDVNLEQDGPDLETITAIRMYIRKDREEGEIHQKISEAMPLFNGYGYKVEMAE